MSSERSRRASLRSPRTVSVAVKGATSYAEADHVFRFARVLLCEPDFVGAGLSTFDGTDYFRVDIKLADLQLIIGDSGSLQTDEFDLFP